MPAEIADQDIGGEQMQPPRLLCGCCSGLDSTRFPSPEDKLRTHTKDAHRLKAHI